MTAVWLVVVLAAPGAADGDKVIDPNAKPMGPALERGAPEPVHPEAPGEAKKPNLPPLPEHPEPPPGTLDPHPHDHGAQTDPVFPAEPRRKGPGVAWIVVVFAAIAGGILFWLLRRRSRTGGRA